MGARTGRGVSDRRSERPRPTPGALFFVLLAAALGGLTPAPATAQEPDTTGARPDSVRLPSVAPPAADTFAITDSILEPDDTLTVERELGDTLDAADAEPPPVLAPLRLPRPLERGFAEGVWVWDREALQRSTALNLAELLEGVASLNRVRAGYYGQPEVVASFLALPGDVELLLDGFPFDPLTSTTVDLSRIALTDLGRVRVERRGTRLRIELFSIELATPDAYTDVRIATGDLDTDGLAGAFMAPRFLFGPFSASAERLSSDGTARANPANTSTAWIRWGLLRPRWGIHAEYRRGDVQREPDSAAPGEATREDMTVRARVRPWDVLTAELYAGHSSVEDLFIDTVTTEFDVTHWGLRTSYDGSWATTQAAVRFREDGDGPGLAAELLADVRPLSWIAVTGEVRHEDWDGESFRTYAAAGRIGPWFGARLFVEWADGEHGVPWLSRPEGSVGVERSLLRAGLDWQLQGWRVGAALLSARGDSVAPPAIAGMGPFGTRDLPLLPGFEVTGFEASFRVPIVWSPLGLEGHYTRLSGAGDGSLAIFQPVEQLRAALVYHGLPLASDQLEVQARLEGEYRGGMLAPTSEAGATAVVAPSRRVNFDLSIRVLDVRAYVSWQNILHRVDLEDVPGRLLPGQTAWFGVDWELWN